MDLGEKIRQLDEQVAAAVRRALDDVRNELRSGLDQAIDDLRGKLAEVSPELPESFFTEEALRQLAEESAPARDDVLTSAKAEGQATGRDELGADLREALATIDRARNQNDVLQALVNQSARFASRAAVLLLRPEGLVGWVSHGFEGGPEDIRTTSVSAQAEDWSAAVAGEAPRRLAPARCALLVSQLDSSVPVEGVAIPVLLRDRVSAIFYADRATAGDRLDVAALQALAYTTALALETLAFRQREATATLEAVVGEVVVAEPAPAPEPEPEESPFELAAEEEEIELVEEAPEPAEEEPPAPSAFTVGEGEELELESFETPPAEAQPVAEAQDIEPSAFEEAAPEEEPEVIELPEDVGEMEVETEEDQTESWRAWTPPADQAAGDAAGEGAGDAELEVVDLESGTFVEEAEPEVEIESFELEPEAPAPPATETTFEEAAPAEAESDAETRTIAGFERELDLEAPGETATPAAGDEAVELEVEDLELDADALEDLPELESTPAGLAEEPEAELELELDEELPEELPEDLPPLDEAPPSWQTEESVEAPAAGGAAPTMTTEAAEATEPAEPAPAAPVEAPPAAVEAPPAAGAPAEESPQSEAAAPAASEPATGTTTGGFPGDTSDLPSGGPIEPPTDVQGPGLAFSDKGPASGASGDDAAHQEARRLARLLVSEIQLYNQDEVEEGRRNGDIYERLKDDIDRSRQLYEERVAPELRESTDYFYQELVRQLGAGDAKALGI